MGSSASKSARKLPTSVPSLARPQPKWAGARTPHPDPLVPEGAYHPEQPHPTSASGAAASPQPSFNYGSSSTATQSRSGSRSSKEGEDGWLGEMDNRGRGRLPSRGDAGMAGQGAQPGVTGKARAGFSGEKDDAVLRDGRDPQFMSNLSRMGQVKIHDAGRFKQAPAPAQRTLNARDPALTTPTQLPPPGHLTAPLLSSLLDKLKTLPPGSDPSKVYKEYRIDAATMSILRRWVNSPSVGEDVIRVEEGERIVEMNAVWVDAADMAKAQARQIGGG